MAEVFISFIHEEKVVAEAVQALLQDKLQKRAFLSADTWQVFAGEDWLKRIKEELESAKVVVLILSQRSVKRPWVNFEAGAAWLADKVVIPACFGGLSKGSLPKPYSSLQALDLPNDWYYLVSSIAHHLGVVGPVPSPPLGPEDEVVARLKHTLNQVRSEIERETHSVD